MAKLLTMLQILIIPKGVNKSINSYLTSKELDCKCSSNLCHYTLFNKDLSIKFLGVRMAMGRPLFINSAFRCQSHNTHVGGVDESSHTTGNALDISTFSFSDIEKAQLIELCKNQFDFVKVYPTFVHCQVNPK